MADIQEMFKEAWSHALSGVNAAEQEAEKVFNRMADAAGFSPEDVRRHAREFGDRLQAQRRELERAIDEGVKKAASKLRVPTKGDIEAIEKRLESLSAKVEALSHDKAKDEEKQI
jgi:poly(hydroxyalkanoate) granule-associated protein